MCEGQIFFLCLLHHVVTGLSFSVKVWGCLFVFVVAQTDTDGDGVGDECDNCPLVSNAAQTDSNFNGVGDSCEGQDK